jgi:biopolymer transport protein ExbD
MKLPDRPRRAARIEMIPVIDAIFLILVSFTYAMVSMIAPRGLHVNLPSVEGSVKTGREPVAVTIGRTGELYVDRQPVDAASLVERVKQRLTADPEGWVLVHGDAKAPLEAALEVLGLLRDGGIEKVTFRTRPREERAEVAP